MQRQTCRSLCLLFSLILLICARSSSASSASRHTSRNTSRNTTRTANLHQADKAAAIQEMPHIPVDYDTPKKKKNNGTATPAPTPHNDSVPVIPVPAGNRTHHNTSAPTMAPTPTPAPSHHKNHTAAPTAAPTTAAPTVAPTVAPPSSTAKGHGFFRMAGKMLAWGIVMGLAVLGYGWGMNHRYQIAYYCRHLGHCCASCNQWLLHKIRPNHTAYAGLPGMEHSDAQSLNTLIFDPPHDSSMFETGDNANYSRDNGFVLGQHSNVNFSNMG